VCKYLIILILIFNYLPAQIPDGYYEETEGLSGEELKSALHEIINDHIEFPYTSTGTDVWDILIETDRDPENPDNVILLYTGWSVNGEQEYNNGNGWSREHVWAKSHGDFGTSMGAGTDVHHLRPCDITVNSARGNKDFDNGGTEYIDGDGPTGCYSDADSWEPRDAVKGDVARMIFYMAVRYEGTNGELDLEMVDYVNSAPDPVHGKFSTLMEWNLLDPVDDFEINRNNIIYENYQGNRNPFIDHSEFAFEIWSSELDDAVFLSSFTVSWQYDEQPLILWTTIMENNNFSWNIYRSDTSDLEDAFQINSTIIYGQGTTTELTEYCFTDPFEVLYGEEYWYWLENFNTSDSSWIHGPISLNVVNVQDQPEIPIVFRLEQNYPNPFNPDTNISFSLSESCENQYNSYSNNLMVQLIIYNLKGQPVKKFNCQYETVKAGNKYNTWTVTWNGTNESNELVPSGIYLYQIESGDFQQTKKMTLLK